MLAFFQRLGIIPVDKERLNNKVRDGANSAAHSLSTMPGRQSGPGAFLVSIVDIQSIIIGQSSV